MYSMTMAPNQQEPAGREGVVNNAVMVNVAPVGLQRDQQEYENQLMRHQLSFRHRNHHHQIVMENGDAVEQEEQQGQQPDQAQQPQQQRQYLAIEDEAEWLRRFGLNGEPHYGAESYANQEEAKQRVQDSVDYQAEIHAKFFEGPSEAEKERLQKIKEWSKETIQIVPQSGSTIECNLGRLAKFSDTIFTMAESRPHFDSDATSPLVLTLRDHSREAVLHFLELLGIKNMSDNGKGNGNDSDNPKGRPHEQHIVACCQIASYLQCNALLDDVLVPILVQSVDSANCLSMCELADHLNLSALLEASVNHMMRSLGSVEEHEIWRDLTPELQSRIQSIQRILQSSNRRQLFFSSFEEYLALFAEQVDYYRERLEDAIHQQSRHPKQSGGWEYAQSKIDQQQERVRILKLVLKEQKRLFRRQSMS